MHTAKLEHVNVTVMDPHRTARLLCDLFELLTHEFSPGRLLQPSLDRQAS